MKFLVTGAAGFLGSACVKQLRERGHEVITTDRRGGIDRPGNLASDVFCRTLPDVDSVIHCAAVQYVSNDVPLIRRREYFHLNNVVATRNVCSRYSIDGTHLIHVGTSMMYEQSGLEIYGTGSAMKGQGVYSESKVRAQAHVDRIADRAATVIPCIIGGPGREGLFRGFVNSMVRHGFVMFPGTGQHKTHMVHVEDVAALLVGIGERRAIGRYNAAGPRPLSILGWISEIESALNLEPVRRVPLPLWLARSLAAASGYRLLAEEQLLMLAQDHVLSVKESEALGWRPRHDNGAIVRDIARHIAGTQRRVAAQQ
jgi:nucleoside-diphosphate-sugar epimerase